MKFNFKDKFVTVEAETMEDNATLIALMFTQASVEKKAHKKHKKHNFMRECETCGKKFKGLQGLGVHKAKCLKQFYLSGRINPTYVTPTPDSNIMLLKETK